jgi:hypothetical protein
MGAAWGSASFSSKGEVTCSSLGVSGRVRSTASTLDSRNCMRSAREESSASKASLLGDGGPGSLQDSGSAALSELGEELELEEHLCEALGPWARLRRRFAAAASASSSRDIANAFGDAIEVKSLEALRSCVHSEPAMGKTAGRVQKQCRQKGGSATARRGCPSHIIRSEKDG